jgi:hypothetical protein
MDVEVSQSQFSGPSMSTVSDRFQKSVPEKTRIRVLAFWQTIKEHKLLPSEGYYKMDVFESVF